MGKIKGLKFGIKFKQKKSEGILIYANQPFSSGSDNPGILPAKRPCFTAKPSPAKPKTAETKENPEIIAALLLNNPDFFSESSSMKPFSFASALF